MSARHDDDGFFDSLFEIARVLPWWLDLGIAAGAGVGLHHVATTPPASPATTTTEVGHQITSTLWHTLAGIGQFLIPLVFVAGAITSLTARRHRTRLLREAGGSGAEVAISQMTWQDFEKLVHELLHQRGYAIEPLGGSRPDGGIDLIARRAGVQPGKIPY